MLPAIIAGLAAVTLLAGAVVVRWWLFAKGLPVLSGTFRAKGLTAAVDVIRDEHGVPHLFAQSLEDLCFAQGWVHVQDRFWQMELNRRVGAGRISEFAGKAAIEADRFLRRIGLRRAAQREADQLHPEERNVLRAYAQGVNAAIAEMRDRLPLELRLLGIKPEPWSPVDTLSWAKVMWLNLGTNAEMEAFRARLVEKVGLDRAAQLHLPHAPGAPAIVPSPSGAGVDAGAKEIRALFEEAKPYLQLGAMAGSNNWVVSGAHTASGKPMLANDPHLALQIPGVWYEVHLVAPGIDVYGTSLPGCPGVVLGHNRQVAWGMTNSGADGQDLYVERFHDKDSDHYEAPDGSRTAERIREVIRVKRKRDVVEEVVLTRHGPLMAGGPGKPGPAIAMKWNGLEPSHIISALLAMNRATDAKAFREALRLWPGPSQNVVFADERDIGYVMFGDIPTRRKGSGFVPVPGWTDEYDWTGKIPFEELPQLWNPPSGIIVTANNPVVDRGYRHHISWDWSNGYRAKRIQELLETKPKLGPDDFRDIQRDVFCAPGLTFARLLGKLAPKDPIEQQALATLLTWDGFATAESAGAAVYETMMVATVRRAFEPELGKELVEQMMGRSGSPLAPSGLLLGRYVGLVLRALEAKENPERWNGILARALTDATAELRRRLGDDVRQWSWGAIHRLRLSHTLAGAKPLSWVFEGREVPLGGDSDTPFQTAYAAHQSYRVEPWAPSWRQIVDLADIKKAVSIHATGQSGHTRTRHHLDFFDKWIKGEFHPHWLDRPDVEAHAEATLKLEPG